MCLEKSLEERRGWQDLCRFAEFREIMDIDGILDCRPVVLNKVCSGDGDSEEVLVV